MMLPSFIGINRAFRPSSGGAWTPANLSGLTAWYDADDASTITLNGSNVSQWNDKSGNGLHASNSTASAQPLYTPTGINNKPSIRFDGVNDNLTAPVINTQNTNTSVFILSKPFSTTVRGAVFKNGDANGYGIGYGATTLDATGNNFIYLREVIQWHPSVSYGGDAPNIISSIIDTTGTTNFLNGNNIQRVNGLPLNPSGNTYIGGYSSQGPPRFFNGDISEVVFVSTALSIQDRQLLEGYLAWKWGLTANLPAGHPYKSAPPPTI